MDNLRRTVARFCRMALNFQAKPKYGDGYEFFVVAVELMEAGFAEEYSAEDSYSLEVEFFERFCEVLEGYERGRKSSV